MSTEPLPPEETPIEETPPAPVYPFAWMPVVLGAVSLVGWDGFSYVDEQGRTYWSGTAEPSEADAIDALTTPRTPPAAVPDVITRAEFVIAARRVIGITEGGIYALISQLQAGEQQETARDLWENAREFRRSNSFVNALAALNGNTSSQVDEVFRVGAALDLD